MAKNFSQVAKAREDARSRLTGQFGMQSHSAPESVIPMLDDDSWLYDDGSDADDSWLLDEPETALPEPGLEPEPVPEVSPLDAAVGDAVRTLASSHDPREKEVAVVAAGEAVALRAEQLAGITAEEVATASGAERAAAEQWLETEYRQRYAAADARAKDFRAQRNSLYEQMRELPMDDPGRTALLEQVTAVDQEAREYRDQVANPLYRELQEQSAIANGDSTPQQRHNLRRLADGYRGALAEVRDMSGTVTEFTPTSTKTARAAFGEAGELFPADWMAASNEAGPMMARKQKARAHYSHRGGAKTIDVPVEYSDASNHRRASTSGERPPYGNGVAPRPSFRGKRAGDMWMKEKENADGTVDWKSVPAESPGGKFRGVVPRDLGAPRGEGWEWHESKVDSEHGFWARPMMRKVTDPDAPVLAEIKTSDDTVKLEGASASLATSAHELAHRTEYVVPGITELEHAFLRRRWQEAGVYEQRPRRLFPTVRGNDEVGRDAGFVAPYVGKIYDRAPASLVSGYNSTEVMSMGVESLFGGSHGGLVGTGGSTADLNHRAFVLGTLAAAGRRD